ncbi:MAG: ornithine cyclodeaminase family protein [Acidobacteria bacterium]|nr:ornithine cyclodeaminase family protein [Acidobacteriota bacterium]
MPILLTEDDVRTLVTMDDLIETMEVALAEFSAREAAQPLRSVLQIGARESYFGVMPASIPSRPALGVKLVTVFASNPERGLPTHLATIILLDPETGALRALVDGRYITEARTAAASAVSVKHLARKDAGVLALIGSGVQARSHLDAIGRVRPLREVRVWSRSAANRDTFVNDMSVQTSASLRSVANAEDAVQGADIVVLVTASRDPVVRNEWVTDGTHICAVGACRPDQREMDAALVARSLLYVDSREGALAEAGDIVLAMKEGAIGASHIVGELGELVAGACRRRVNDGQVTIFKSLGMAVEDVAAAHLAYSRARERGVGSRFTVDGSQNGEP